MYDPIYKGHDDDNFDINLSTLLNCSNDRAGTLQFDV